MEFIQHTINWCRGEIFEGKVFGLYGFLIILVSFFFWKMGKTPFTKAMFVPLLVVGLLYLAAGSYLVINNNHRIETFQQAYDNNPAEFVKGEKERTDDFIKWYPYTMVIVSAIIVIGIALYIFMGGAWGRAIGLALLLLGMSALFLDHFSEERADIYHQEIVKQLKIE